MKLLQKYLLSRLAMLFFGIAASLALLPSHAHAQLDDGPYIDECTSGVVDGSQDIEQTVCIFGSESELYSSVETDDDGRDGYVADIGVQIAFNYDWSPDTTNYLNPSWTASSELFPITSAANGEYTAQAYYTYCWDGQGTFGNEYQCYWQGQNEGLSVSATLNAPTSILYPAYQVTSIIYSAPGNDSSNGYTNSLTDGVSSSIGSSFTSGSSTTFSTGSDFTGGSASFTFGLSGTTGNSSAFTETFTDTAGVAVANSSANPNAINHQQDLFMVWLNPAVSMVETGLYTVSYGIGTQATSGGTPQEMDIVEVPASVLQGSPTTIPAALLNKQYDSFGYPTLAGLASICAGLNLSDYNAGTCTLAGQCGCVASDFTGILATDPLLTFAATTNPLTADTDGATTCLTPTSSTKCRYIPVPISYGSSTQENELLAGPACSGCSRPVNSFTQSDATATTQTQNESTSETVGYSWKVDFLTFASMSSSTQFTWTDTESSGETNGHANSQAVGLSSATVGCYEDIPVFEDTVFHTFVFYQPSGNSSCP